ncbi:putative choline transporter, neither null mutation nor overexpression affects choline transport [Chytriomyces hyalinus]|nr:putative choline transporter, neither null mutation nor overexpression affects choline transport [Chytriomyces hyalinus]
MSWQQQQQPQQPQHGYVGSNELLMGNQQHYNQQYNNNNNPQYNQQQQYNNQSPYASNQYQQPQQPYAPQQAFQAPYTANAATNGAPKPYNPVPPPNPPTIVSKPKYNDVWATALFAVFMAGFVGLAVLGVPMTLDSLRDGSSANSKPTNAKNGASYSVGLSAADIGGLVAASVGTGVPFSVLYFFLMLNFPGPLIKFSYFFNVVMMAAFAAYMGYVRSWIACGIFALFAVLLAVSYWGIRSRIPFSQIVLETVCKISGRLNGTLFVALGGMIVSAAFSVVWLATLLGMAEWVSQKNLASGVMYAILVLLVFMNFWFNEVVRNTIHSAVCGTFATYYFMGMQQPNSDTITLPSNHTTAKSLGRALTTSFGSICFGSLLVSLIRTLKFIAQMAKNDSAQDGNILCCIIATCFECILACLADILDYFNKYAYTEIAIYGKSYCEGGKDAWNLFKYKGIDLIINDVLIGYVLGMGSFISAILCAFAGFLFVYLKGGLGTLGNGPGVYAGVCLISAFIGMWLFLVLLEVIDSGTAATFVCLAEDPATIQRQQPRFFESIQQRFPDVNWGMQSIAY